MGTMHIVINRTGMVRLSLFIIKAEKDLLMFPPGRVGKKILGRIYIFLTLLKPLYMVNM